MVPSLADIELLRNVDPQRVERWTPFIEETVAGWCFEVVGVLNGYHYRFFCCRRADDPSYRIVPLDPVVEIHGSWSLHLIVEYFDGQPMVVLDPPGAPVIEDVLAARTAAIMWVHYVSSFHPADQTCSR